VQLCTSPPAVYVKNLSDMLYHVFGIICLMIIRKMRSLLIGNVGETVFTRPRQYIDEADRGEAAENQAEARQSENHVNVLH